MKLTRQRGFEIHDPESAPEAARSFLEQVEKEFGMIPNLERVMAEAPALLDAYGTVWSGFGKASLSAVERQVVMQAVNVFHACDY